VLQITNEDKRKPEAQRGEVEGEREVVSKREVVPEDERASESCLHCEINDLVQEYIDGQERVDIAELAAATISHLGHAFLEKSGVVEGQSRRIDAGSACSGVSRFKRRAWHGARGGRRICKVVTVGRRGVGRRMSLW
jgi:hypothetical protein